MGLQMVEGILTNFDQGSQETWGGVVLLKVKEHFMSFYNDLINWLMKIILIIK